MDRQNAEPAAQGLGLVGVRERFAPVHGTRAVHSQPGKSARLLIDISRGTNHGD
jgi:signal transduction histidine kinase